ncbi:unnamed protein product [Pleuronectes platessa]|uniref:Uncharacterized protein n=1 Tax=Pleuronectes platessa TaxID=8262 RepID=A0A9N7YIP1_PLEPL|nr:unnamed protein product [Pleuronectes platessa]
MSGLADMFKKKLEDYVEDKVKDAVKEKLGFGDKDEDEDEDKKGGGIFSLFGGDKKKDEDKGGLFSFGGDKEKDEDKGGFFSKIFDRDDDDDDRKEKRAGFAGLFSEQQAGGADAGGQGHSAGEGGLSVGVNDGDLFDDLMEVAAETSQE